MADWNFEDFLRRLESIKGIGSLDELARQVPGLREVLRDVDFRLEELDPIERILRAMTLEERLHPDLLEGEGGSERRQRIADDSESPLESVESLISQFNRLRAMLRERSPEEVLREAIEEHQRQAGAEPWQQTPDWRGEPGEPEEPAPTTPAELPWTERVDMLLRKIAAAGMASLSEQERAFLDEASQRYRNRRQRSR